MLAGARRPRGRTFVAAVVLAALAGAAATAGSAGHVAPSGTAESCAAGAKAARIAGRRVCLRAGQRCNARLDRQYHRYGFHCHGRRRLVAIRPPVPPPRQVTLAVTGQPQVVFDWTTDRCADDDIPDLPARAFRSADGSVQLISTHFVGRRFIGPDLDHVRRDCAPIFASDHDPDPAAFDDNEWLASPYTLDGSTVYALVHDEYQGHTHSGQCSSGDYATCWYNAVTLAVSSDGGKTYADVPSRHLVASVPYRYVPDGGPTGMFTPSNIVFNDRDGYFYAFSYINLRDSLIGDCLMRTRNLADAASWRAWSGGTSFETSFVDPYDDNPNPDQHLCKPIEHGEPRDLQPNGLTFNTVARQWLLIGQGVEGAYFSLSPDLIHWSPPQLFFRAQVTWDYTCGDPDPIAYPTVLDPLSPTRNFETTGATAFLYFTQFHYSGCLQTLDRDLVRVPVVIRPG